MKRSWTRVILSVVWVSTYHDQAGVTAISGLIDEMKDSISYRDAGVDIKAGDAFVDRIKPLAKKNI